jgi:renalase
MGGELARGTRSPAGLIEADAVVLSAPVPQSAALLAGHVSVPELTYDPTICLLVALDRPPSIPAPGGLQLADHATWSWIADNVAKGISRLPAVTLHTRPEVAAARCGQDVDSLTADLLSAARPWLQDAEVLDVVLHRWRYATLNVAYPKRCWTARGGRLVLAGDAFGGSRVEGAFLSGLAAASAVAGAEQ